MNCREFIEFLMAYLEEELPEAERSVFESHLAACPPCKEYLETYRQSVELGRKVCGCGDSPPPADAPEALINAILRARRAGRAE